MVKGPEFINTPEGLKSLVDWVARQDTRLGDLQPPLYIDIEGERVSRHGRISLMTVLTYPSEFRMRPHIIDIHSLGPAAFSTAGELGKTFQDILESPQIVKVFFDVRNDSDALYALYGIELQGVRDIQLMESARRLYTHRRRYLSGLSKCIEEAPLDKGEKDQWRLCKETGEALWNPGKGGSYKASQKRVCVSQMADYQPDGPGRALSPWSAEQNRLLDEWNAPPPPTDYFSYDSHGDWYPYDDDIDDGNDFEDWTRADWQGPPS